MLVLWAVEAANMVYHTDYKVTYYYNLLVFI